LAEGQPLAQENIEAFRDQETFADDNDDSCKRASPLKEKLVWLV